MILDDFVMLGTTVPEPKKDGRVFVCSAGVSAELRSLVRIYPLARPKVPHRWDIHRVPLERNPQDSRPESYKIAGDRGADVHNDINSRFERLGSVKHADRIGMLRSYAVGSIKEANAKHLSLAIIHPESIELTFKHNADSPDSPQLALFDRPGEPPSGAKRFPFTPILNFKDELGWNHEMLRDWGTFERQRKSEIEHRDGGEWFRRNLAGCLHLDENSSLLVGNMNNNRTSWLVISVLNGIREAPTLFDAIADERRPISDKMRREVYERDGWKCVRCGSGSDLTVDHDWPHSKGGASSMANYRTLCKPCNLAKSDRIEAA